MKDSVLAQLKIVTEQIGKTINYEEAKSNSLK